MADNIFTTASAVDDPDDVSPVYRELLVYVEKNFSGIQLEIRQLIFSYAYTLYSRDKKSSIASHRSDGKEADSDVVKTCHVPMSNDDAYRRYSDQARLEVNRTFGVLGVVALDAVANKINFALEAPRRLTLGNVFREVIRTSLVIILVSIIIETSVVVVGHRAEIWNGVLHDLRKLNQNL